ncbi:hypothetical protein FPZ12_043775 [Amycolatopsis acidicola]|uniref:Uncharacterized protein n=1 Tax=Amycolatopsis acidicola TaxID=2596893 RepID=A0A5N0UN81_9PSEU|nr:hypothetical protein [Amycolatopsis acidicola]KAA9149194.1 hypothetical protein FPZ12_043775 [Amycolatopsis acidicola]
MFRRVPDAAIQLAVERMMAGLGFAGPVREMAGRPAALGHPGMWTRLAAASAQWCAGWAVARHFPWRASRFLVPSEKFATTMRFTGAAWALELRAPDGSRYWADLLRGRGVGDFETEIVRRLTRERTPVRVPAAPRGTEPGEVVPVDFTDEVVRRSKVFPSGRVRR